MRTKGQSLLEIIMLLPVIVAFWAAILWFSHILIISIQLLQTARHGVFCLTSRTQPLSPETERDALILECRDFLLRENRMLLNERLAIDVNLGRRLEPVGPKSLLNPLDGLSGFRHLSRQLRALTATDWARPVEVIVRYDARTPALLRAIPGFPPFIPLRGYCASYR